MASSVAKWREEQILIICPGSRTTMAQLGCSELTPPTHRIPTRMFRDEDEWRPYYTYQRTRIVDGEEKEEWVEDVDEDKGAVWPIEGGRIVQMDAFLAFLDHVHSLLTTTYHNTPIMLMASPQWTRPDCETIARYIFEKTRTPALCMIHSGIATQYGLKWSNMTVVDIGYEKVDVTAIHDGRVVNHMDLGSATPDREISGGEVFTQKLMKLLEAEAFTHDMAEQLKKSTICEVLPYAPSEEGLMELPEPTPAPAHPPPPPSSSNPAAEASAPINSEPSKPQEETENGEAEGDDEGVLDVAGIVASGQTKEFLAKKEKEKGKPGRKPKDKDGDAGPAKPTRMPNSKRMRNTFAYEEIVLEDVPPEPKPAPAPVPAPETAAAVDGTTSEAPKETVPVPGAGVSDAMAPAPEAKEPESKPTEPETNAALPVDAEPKKEEAKNDAPRDEESKNGEAGIEKLKIEDNKPVDVMDITPAEPAASETSANPVPSTTEDTSKDASLEAGTTTDPLAPTSTAAETNGTSHDNAGSGEGKSSNEAVPSSPPLASADATAPAATNSDAAAGVKRDAPENNDTPEQRPKRVRRDIEVGLERFTFADRAEIDRIVSTIYRTVQGIDDMYMRPACWENLVFVGNGSRLRGLKENILQTLNARHLVSPSTATMFTSELPSNMATPTGTGSQTPTGSFTGAPHQLSASGVNPLLQAATTANTLGASAAAAVGTPQAGSEAGGHTHHFHSQTPTNIKTVTFPTYLGEWSKNGFEEAMFLGAQVAARVTFCLHSNLDAQAIEAQRLASLSRVDYNELGPKGIRTHSMLS